MISIMNGVSANGLAIVGSLLARVWLIIVNSIHTLLNASYTTIEFCWVW